MQIFIINLARRPDRLSGMRAQLAQLGLDFERFDAIDGSRLLPPPEAALTPGEIACHRSHRACWQKLIDSGDPLAVILEDDLLISPRLAHFLSRPDRWPADADIIRLETFRQLACISTRNIKAPCGIRLHRLLTEQFGAAAYVISRACAARLLADDQSTLVPVDTLIYRQAYPALAGLRIYQADPAPCIQGDVYFSGNVPATMVSDLEPLRRLRYQMLEERQPPEPEKPLAGFARILEEAKRVGRPLYRPWVFGDRQQRIEFDGFGDHAAGASPRRRFA